MRNSGFLLGACLLAAATGAAQTPPLITLAPAPQPIYGPKTVGPVVVACTDIPVTAHQPPALHVVAPHAADGREFSYRDDVVVLNGGTPQGLAPGQRYFTRRLLMPRYGEPVSERSHGYVHTSGWLTVIAADEHSALARVDYACDAVASGDYLDAYVEPVLPPVAEKGARTEFANMGRVLQGTDRNEGAGAGDFITIDRGSAEGLAAGTRVAFYRDRANGAPLVELGTGIVIELSGNAAKVVLDRARFEVSLGDYWAIRQP
jgi:hypothetical protein